MIIKQGLTTGSVKKQRRHLEIMPFLSATVKKTNKKRRKTSDE